MGETIRRTAAATDILNDVRTANTAAQSKGGLWKQHADEKIAPTVVLADAIEARLTAAEAALKPILAALDAQDDIADRVLGRVSDNIWNDVGRPQNDPALTVLFPNGIAYYAGGDVSSQPRRMRLLADLLESNIHPRLTREQAKKYADEVRAAAAELQAKVDAAAEPTEQVENLRLIRTAIARVGAANLASLKRSYKAASFSEAEIHTVIPDRPSRKVAEPKPE